MADFAEVGDLIARWKSLSSAEMQAAEVLLGDASARIRAEFPTIDDRLAADPPTMDAAIPRMVACAMVKRAMLSGGGGITQQSANAGPFSQQVVYANPTGDLYLTKQERVALGKRQRAFTVSMIQDAAPAALPDWFEA